MNEEKWIGVKIKASFEVSHKYYETTDVTNLDEIRELFSEIVTIVQTQNIEENISDVIEKDEISQPKSEVGTIK